MLDPEGHKQKTARNRKHAQDRLAEEGIGFTSHNDGAHLIVHGSPCVIDYWPGTGLFVDRLNHKRGRGIRNLIKKVKRGES